MATESFDVPEILNLPPKLRPIISNINKYGYFLLDGGRGSAKTQSIARFILWLCEEKKIRVICGREIQNTVEESVYTVFKDLIEKYQLSDSFDVTKVEIRCKATGSTIHFRGFREQGRVNIKGIEGVDILWVDESQSVTKPTLETIIPTVRKAKSKVFWSMNRFLEDDPVYVEFSTRADCLHIHVDYRDNDHCTEKNKKEAEICREKNWEDYEHVWLGMPLKKSVDHVFGIDDLRESAALDMDRIGVRRTVLANDPARNGNCENVFTTLQSRGPLMWEQTHIEARKGIKGDETVGRHAALHRDIGTDMHVVDCDGLGGPICDLIDSREFEIREFYATKDYERDKMYRDRRTAAYFKLQDLILKGWLKIINDPILIQQLLAIRKKTKPDGTVYILSKEEMAKGDALHPPILDIGRADALMMATWFADELMGPNFMENSPSHGTLENEIETFQFDKTMPEYGD